MSPPPSPALHRCSVLFLFLFFCLLPPIYRLRGVDTYVTYVVGMYVVGWLPNRHHVLCRQLARPTRADKPASGNHPQPLHLEQGGLLLCEPHAVANMHRRRRSTIHRGVRDKVDPKSGHRLLKPRVFVGLWRRGPRRILTQGITWKLSFLRAAVPRSMDPRRTFFTLSELGSIDSLFFFVPRWV